jgi:hypothetical protein
MVQPESEQDGSINRTTEYSGQELPTSRFGRRRSIWALLIATILLVVVMWVAILHKGDSTDPAPSGSAGSGMVRESGPASNKR